MRSRRHKLQVSTFPFLAVLLCAMGALLLVLLVMDRRAHDAARARANEAVRRAAEDAAREAESRRAALAQAGDAWRQERDAEHARLQGQVAETQAQAQTVRELARAAAGLQAEEDGEAALKQKIDAAHARAAENEEALAKVRGEAAKQAQETEASRKAREQMTADLAQLEGTLADLKAAREKAQKTYSVVPYNGKRGENRRPLYIECAAGEVIFHPDRLSIPETRNSAEFQTEVDRRLARLKEQLSPADAASFSPYLMLLVRPDGVVSYYRLREALRNLKIDFGYEFIDQDWALDFPAGAEGTPSQTWMTAAKPPPLAPSAAPPGAPLMGVPAGSGMTEAQAAAAQPAGRNSPPRSGVDGPFAGIGRPSTGQDLLITGPPGPASPAAAVRASPVSSAPGATIGIPGGPAPGPAAPGGPTGSPGSGDAIGSTRVALAPPPPGGPTGSPGGSEPNGASRAALGPVPPPPGPPGTGETGSSGAAGSAAIQGSPPAVAVAPRPAAAIGQASAAPQGDSPPWAPNGGSPSTPGTAAPPKGAVSNAPSTPPGKPAKGTAANKGGAADDPDDEPFLRTPPSPLPITSRAERVLRPARLSGDRDWILYVECKPEGVVIYPTQLLVPASVLAHSTGSNPLLQSVQQLIDRKQASVRPGEPPYRPEVRFLVHPEALRTYHLAYPLLDALAAPKTAQDLGPDDDVPTIVAH